MGDFQGHHVMVQVMGGYGSYRKLSRSWMGDCSVHEGLSRSRMLVEVTDDCHKAVHDFFAGHK